MFPLSKPKYQSLSGIFALYKPLNSIIVLTEFKLYANMYSWLKSHPVVPSGAAAYPKNTLWVHEKTFFSR